MLVSRFPFPLTLPGITSASYRESRQRWKMGLAKRGKVDRSRGNKDSGDLCPDKRESSILIRVCMFVCMCVYILLGHIRVPNVYVHFSDIRGETCYCVMISERFVASRCNPAGISTANDRCFFNALNFFPFFSIFFSFFPSPFKLSTN